MVQNKFKILKYYKDGHNSKYLKVIPPNKMTIIQHFTLLFIRTRYFYKQPLGHMCTPFYSIGQYTCREIMHRTPNKGGWPFIYIAEKAWSTSNMKYNTSQAIHIYLYL